MNAGEIEQCRSISTSIGLMAFAGALLLAAAGFRACPGRPPQPPLPVGRTAPPCTARARRRRRGHRAGAGAAQRMDRRVRRLRPSADAGDRDPRRPRPISRVPGRPVAARRQAQHLARHLRQTCARPHARPADHGSARRPARVHQGVLGLSRHSCERGAYRHGRELLPATRPSSTRSSRPMASTAMSSPRSGASSRTTARSAATVRCCARPRRSPASAAARPISATSFCRRWRFCTAATCGPSSSSVPGPARSGRPSSCRPRSSVSPSTSTATAAATSSNSVADLIASTANNLKKDGWVAGATWGYEVVIPKGFNFLLADRSRQHSLAEWEARAPARRRQAVPAQHDAPICWCRPATRAQAS